MPIKIKVHAKYLPCLFGNVCSFLHSLSCRGNAQLTRALSSVSQGYQGFHWIGTLISQFPSDAVQALAGLVQEQMVQQEELTSSGGQGLQQAGKKIKKGNVNLGTSKIPW